jgi:hypothetical protein
VARTFLHMPPLETSCREAQPAVHPLFWPIAAGLLIWHALREGVAAHHHYEDARCRGIPHDTAIRHTFGLAHRDDGLCWDNTP